MSYKCTEGLEILMDEWRIWKGIEGLAGGELEKGREVGKCMKTLSGGICGWLEEFGR